MSRVEAMDLARLLGVRTSARRGITAVELSRIVHRGLPVAAIDNLCRLIAPDDAGLRHRIVPKATLARRQRSADKRLSPEESDKVARLARVWASAAEVWDSHAEAQRFLAEPHLLLRGRVPRELALESEIGARAVEDLLGRLQYGSAV